MPRSRVARNVQVVRGNVHSCTDNQDNQDCTRSIIGQDGHVSDAKNGGTHAALLDRCEDNQLQTKSWGVLQDIASKTRSGTSAAAQKPIEVEKPCAEKQTCSQKVSRVAPHTSAENPFSTNLSRNRKPGVSASGRGTQSWKEKPPSPSRRSETPHPGDCQGVPH